MSVNCETCQYLGDCVEVAGSDVCKRCYREPGTTQRFTDSVESLVALLENWQQKSVDTAFYVANMIAIVKRLEK